MYRGTRRRGIGRIGRNPFMNRVMRMQNDATLAEGHAASYAGVVFKTTLLLTIMFALGILSATMLIREGVLIGGYGVLIGAPIIGLIAVLLATFIPRLTKPMAFIYSVVQGLFLGVISALYTIMFGDYIVPVALIGTMGIFFAMLFLYRSGIITVGSTFRKAAYAMLFGLIIANLFLFIMFMVIGFAQFQTMYLLIVIIGVILAGIFLLLDFDNITQMVEAGVEKQYEWMMSFSLVITIVWLFIEMLRLLAIIASRSRN